MKKLWNEILAENITLMASTENLQVTGAKHKEIVDIFSKNEARLQSSKKLKKYYRDTVVKMENDNPCKRYIYAR